MNARSTAKPARRAIRFGTLTIGRKLGLLCLAFSLPVLTLLGFFVADRHQIRSASAEELRSEQSLEPLRLLRYDLTTARSQAIAVISGKSRQRTQLEGTQRQVTADFHRLVRTSHQPRTGDLQRLFSRWQSLAAQPLQPTFTNASYGALLEQPATHTEAIGSSSPVVRDQEQTTFWLGQALVRTLPAIDSLQTRLVDTADTAARRGRVQQQERVELQSLSTQLDTLLDEAARVFQRSGQAPALRAALQTMLSSQQLILDDVKFHLTDIGSPYLTSVDLRAHSMSADVASLRLWQLSSRIFKNHLSVRISHLDRDTGTAIVATLAAVGITLFLATTVIRSIRRPLRLAADVARRISRGDAAAELPAERADEIGVMLQAMRGVMRDLQHRASVDPLTGLVNRNAFTDSVETALANRSPSKGVALLFVDLDHFKQINDSMGHACGDALLVALANRLRASTRPTDLLGRFGGDEFTILLEDLDSVEQAAQGAERLASSLSKAFSIGGRELFVTASVGIGYTTDPRTRPGDLLREADVALYRSKTDGRDRHTVFLETMGEGAVDVLHLENDLRRAVDGHELRLEFQPIIALDTGAAAGAEALIRWRRPGHGLVGPEMFIPVAESNGLIQPIGLWALRHACRWAADRNLRGDPLFVSVNISPRQLHQAEVADFVARTLAETGLPADRLRLEITETAIMEDEQVAVATLSSLRALGVSLLIDDFGTGYSSLRALQTLPVDGIKIDLSFLRGIGDDITKQVLVRSIIEMGAALRLTVVAEGVEEIEQHVFLAAAGCQLAQGFLYSGPLRAERFEAWLGSARATLPV